MTHMVVSLKVRDCGRMVSSEDEEGRVTKEDVKIRDRHEPQEFVVYTKSDVRSYKR